MYLLFSGEHYYPSGGWNDFKGSFSTREEAQMAFRHGGWAHVVDSSTMKIVTTYNYGWIWV